MTSIERCRARSLRSNPQSLSHVRGTRFPAIFPLWSYQHMNQTADAAGMLWHNRIGCEQCRRQIRIDFTEATLDGELDLRNRCAACCGLQPFLPTESRHSTLARVAGNIARSLGWDGLLPLVVASVPPLVK